MYFTAYHPLKVRLKNRDLSDREALPYLVLFVGLYLAVTCFPVYDNFNFWDAISGVISSILAVCGVIYAYKCNGGDDGYDLIQKYIVLGWVVAFRCLLGFMPLAIIAYLIGGFFNVVGDVTGWFDVCVVSAFELFLYFKIGSHIRDTKA